jgi:hypothetical protein
MEVDHSITDAAQEALLEESAEYADRLRETAIKEALTSRGTPVEVTASDVKRAARTLRAVRADEVVERYPATYKLMTAYFWAGVAMGGLALLLLAVPFKELGFALPFSERIFATLGLAGAFLTAASAAMRWFMRVQLRR